MGRVGTACRPRCKGVNVGDKRQGSKGDRNDTALVDRLTSGPVGKNDTKLVDPLTGGPVDKGGNG